MFVLKEQQMKFLKWWLMQLLGGKPCPKVARKERCKKIVGHAGRHQFKD